MTESKGPDSYVLCIIRTKQGEAAAFNKIVKDFQDMAYCYAYSIIRNSQSAEDAVQEAFFEAYRNIYKLRNLNFFPGWLKLIVKKHCFRIMRRKTYTTVDLPNDFLLDKKTETPLELLDKKQEIERLEKAVSKLSENQQKTVSLFYLKGYNQNETAKLLGASVSTIKKRLFDARKKLRQIYLKENRRKQEDLLEGLRKSRVSHCLLMVLARKLWRGRKSLTSSTGLLS